MNSFSLPIDMKIQIALIQNSIPGIYLKSSPFEHASKTGKIQSEVKQTMDYKAVESIYRSLKISSPVS